MSGFADHWELRRCLSAHAARHVAVETRPSLLAHLPEPTGPGVTPGERAWRAARRRWATERLPIHQAGTWMGRSTVGPVLGTDCWIPHRDSFGIVAAPQTGKTSLIGHHLLDFPGAVVSTSTKPDLYLTTAALRARRARSRRVELFNPEGLGDGLVSTFRWSPVAGCTAPGTARRRAGHMIGAVGAGEGENELWDKWAAGVLAALLMAADRAGYDMATVAEWVYHEDTGCDVALGALREAAGAPVPQLVIDALSQVQDTKATKTRASIFMSMRDAVGFMTNPAVAATCCPAAGEPRFDVAAFLTDRGTLYVLGSDDEYSGIAPLLAALTGEVFEQAKYLATVSPTGRNGRLDPELLIELDEVALITPVALDRWLADAGGRGIHLGWAAQSLSQLWQRWDQQGLRTILNATNALLCLGGTKDDADLTAISTLAGTRLERVPDPDGDGSGHARFERHLTIPPEKVRTLPRWHGILIHRDAVVTIVRFTPAWRRHDVRRSTAVSTELRNVRAEPSSNRDTPEPTDAPRQGRAGPGAA